MNNESNFQARYDRLNDEQKLAVDTIEGPVMVIAGPGSGKTELLGLRVANILRQNDTDPRSILCLTFTDSAAVNMRKRLEGLIGPLAYRVSINTFHTFGVWVIERYREHFYGGAVLRPADQLTQIEVMDTIIKNLKFDDPLKITHPDQGYIYLNSAINAISELKKSGLTPTDFNEILIEVKPVYQAINQILSSVFANRISKKIFPELESALKSLAELDMVNTGSGIALVNQVVRSFEKAIQEAVATDNTKPVTAWKTKNLRSIDGSWALKETASYEKLESLAAVYQEYLDQMYTAGYFDFDDMILETLVAMRSNPDLLADLQEQFQYVLVDEFQDTNEAQLEIIKLLGSNEANNNRPNVMTVGDDDQAIYRFQGAEVGNLAKFSRMFDDVKTITLLKNYRSTKNIVDLSLKTISQSSERLEDILPQISKKLEAFSNDDGYISKIALPSQAHEFSYIAQEIKRLITDHNVSPSDIAIIGRRHKTLEAVVQYLKKFELPMRYERQLDVLKEAHIVQIITTIRLLAAIGEGDNDTTDSLLSTVITYPFWNIPSIETWKISTEAYKNRTPWLDVMLAGENSNVQKLANFLIDISQRAKFEPVEVIIDNIVGSHVSLIPDDPDSEVIEAPGDVSSAEYQSGFREHYFSEEKFNNSKSEYLNFLSSLRVFVSAIREHKQGQLLSITDLIRFVDVHEENEKLVADTSPFINAIDAVNVLTAHKAKGMEFKVVFIASCVQSEWVPKNRGNAFTWPRFLDIGADNDTADDKLRLFYVAMTRAIEHLYLTGYTHSDTGKEIEELEFLSGLEDTELDSQELPEISDVLESRLSSRYQLPKSLEENAFLKSLLEDYKLSATHLNNYLDVTKGGPQAFLEQNLLRFPQGKSPSGSYGTAVHNSLDWLIRSINAGKTPDNKEIVEKFTEFLSGERLSSTDFEHYLDKGTKEITAFVNQRMAKFNPTDISELNFSNQNVIIDGAHLTGKIDWVQISDGNSVVRDFKTGKPLDNWKGTSDYEKIKLHKYRQQLMFYKILITNSRDYHNKFNPSKGIIDFVQSKKDEILSIEMEFDNTEIENFKKLITTIYSQITNLDFPDISNYPESYKGILEFENYLLRD